MLKCSRTRLAVFQRRFNLKVVNRRLQVALLDGERPIFKVWFKPALISYNAPVLVGTFELLGKFVSGRYAPAAESFVVHVPSELIGALFSRGAEVSLNPDESAALRALIDKGLEVECSNYAGLPWN